MQALPSSSALILDSDLWARPLVGVPSSMSNLMLCPCPPSCARGCLKHGPCPHTPSWSSILSLQLCLLSCAKGQKNRPHLASYCPLSLSRLPYSSSILILLPYHCPLSNPPIVSYDLVQKDTTGQVVLVLQPHPPSVLPSCQLSSLSLSIVLCKRVPPSLFSVRSPLPHPPCITRLGALILGSLAHLILHPRRRACTTGI